MVLAGRAGEGRVSTSNEERMEEGMEPVGGGEWGVSRLGGWEMGLGGGNIDWAGDRDQGWRLGTSPGTGSSLK